MSMIARNCGGTVPEPAQLGTADDALLAAARGLLGKVRPLVADLGLHRALETIWEVVGQANRYVDAMAPWTLRKEDPVRMATVLWTLAETLRHLATLTQPFMPAASAKILDQLGVQQDARSFSSLESGPALDPGARLPGPSPVFPRFTPPEVA
jgi:methionyl-tRNA synthetase